MTGTARDEHPTHGAILQAVLEVQRQIGQLTNKVDEVVRDVAVITMDTQGMKSSVVDLKNAIGTETTNEDGKKTGSGIFGRVGRMENRQLVYDRWTNRAIGISMAATLFGTILWYVIGDKVGHVLK